MNLCFRLQQCDTDILSDTEWTCVSDYSNVTLTFLVTQNEFVFQTTAMWHYSWSSQPVTKRRLGGNFRRKSVHIHLTQSMNITSLASRTLSALSRSTTESHRTRCHSSPTMGQSLLIRQVSNCSVVVHTFVVYVKPLLLVKLSTFCLCRIAFVDVVYLKGSIHNHCWCCWQERRRWHYLLECFKNYFNVVV